MRDEPASAEVLRRIIKEHSRPTAPRPTHVSPSLEPPDESLGAVIFDVYGTLLVARSGNIGIRTLSKQPHTFVEAVQRAGLGKLTAAQGDTARQAYFDCIEELDESNRSQGREDEEIDIHLVWEAVLRKLRRESELSKETVERLAVEHEVIANPTWPTPGAAEALQALKSRKLRLGIVSNAQFFTPLTVEALFGRTLGELGFDPELISFSFEVGARKPSPAVFRPILDRLAELDKLTPPGVLYIANDVKNDLSPAKEVGMKTCLYAGDTRSLRLRRDEAEQGANAPDWTITGFEQILRIVGSAA